ncbi:MAG: hypothetical protein OXG82_08185 [Gammaproteobacteria bacterium]|nr:hypothetical protein [Gammaproteobacteria bacterium]
MGRGVPRHRELADGRWPRTRRIRAAAALVVLTYVALVYRAVFAMLN